VSNLNFGDGSWEEAGGVVMDRLQELVAIVKGNGKDGMQTTLNSFITEYRTDRAADTKFHNTRDQEIKDALAAADKKRDDARAEIALRIGRTSLSWTIAGVLSGFAALMVGILSIFGMVYLSHHSQLEPPELFQRLIHSQVYTADMGIRAVQPMPAIPHSQ